MSSTDIRTGVYKVYSGGIGLQTRLLVETTQSNVITNFMAIVVTWALARFAAVFLRLFLHQHAQLVQGETAEGWAWGYLQASVRRPDGQITLPNSRPVTGHFLKYLSFGAAGVMYAAATLFCGIYTARLASDSTMVSSSPQCGLYLPSSTLSSGQAPLDWHTSVLPYAYEAESDSANWAKNCYNATDTKDGCNFFVQRQIPYQVQENASCPFDDDMCYYGPNTGIRFYTPPVSSSALGLNAPRTFEIRRITECAPINRNETFVQATKNEASIIFRYYYGESWTWGNASHLTISDGKLINAATYELVALPSGIPTYWNPLPSLQPPLGATTTLLLILAGKVYHTEPRDDPVFPADRVRSMPSDITGGERPYWISSLGHATVLGCVDKTEWRDPHYGDEWSPYWVKLQQRSSDPKVRAAAWLLYYSIQNSNIYYSVNARSAGALDAQARLARFYQSLPLAEEQWKVEAKQLFETSLARIQVNIKAIARGELAKYPGFAKVNASIATEGDAVDMCDDTYIFNGHGYTNIYLVPWLLTFILSCVMIFFAIPLKAEATDEIRFLGVICWKAAHRAGKRGWELVGPYVRPIASTLWAIVKALLKSLGKILLQLFNWVKEHSRSRALRSASTQTTTANRQSPSRHSSTTIPLGHPLSTANRTPGPSQVSP